MSVCLFVLDILVVFVQGSLAICLKRTGLYAFCLYYFVEPQLDKTNKNTCAPSEDSLLFGICLPLVSTVIELKERDRKQLNHKQDEIIAKTKLFGENFIQIGR